METQINNWLNKPKLNISFFFLSLGVLVSLIVSVVAFLNLAFETLNKRFPDVLNSSYEYGYNVYDMEGIRVFMAMLIIFFPVFLLISFFWNKFNKKSLGSIDEIIKKWMLYIILFLSSLIIIIDLVILVKYFLSGEITNRFLYKVIIALCVALIISVYYIFELIGKRKMFNLSLHFWAGIKSFIIVVLLICFSFSVTGSPKNQRLFRLDERRMNDLKSIQMQIINYWQQKEKLPENLKVLINPMTNYSVPTPPEFEKGEKYEYIIKNEKDLVFELCAVFAKEMPKGWREYSNGGVTPMYETKMDTAVSSYPYYGDSNESWDHKEGRTCFERKIDKDMYPPFEKIRN